MYELETCMMSIPIYMERMLNYIQPNYQPLVDIFLFTKGINRCTYGSIFGKRDLLAIDHIMLALFWSHVPNMK